MSADPKPTRGGARPGAGRPPIYDEPATRRGILLPQSVVDWLRSHGSSLGDAVVRLVREAQARE